jgi:hypothetical protein
LKWQLLLLRLLLLFQLLLHAQKMLLLFLQMLLVLLGQALLEGQFQHDLSGAQLARFFLRQR